MRPSRGNIGMSHRKSAHRQRSVVQHPTGSRKSSAASTATPIAARASKSVPRIAVLGDPAGAPRIVGRVLSEKTRWSARLAESWIAAALGEATTEANFEAALLIDRPTADLDGELLDTWTSQALEVLYANQIPVAIVTRRPQAFANREGALVVLAPETSIERVHAVLDTLIAIRPTVAGLSRELSNIRYLGNSLQGHYHQLDQDLYLASRLQHDFLPQAIPEVGAVRFTAYYRPCSLVSGDIYDIFRLDDKNVGFYLADAVGHGVAAGLLTMYIKHAIRPRNIRPDGFDLVAPSQVLESLNEHLIAQHLPESQFVTAWYGRIDVEAMRLHFAVAGHPPALLVESNGTISELRGDGCLLGVFPSQPFVDFSVPLEQGQRIIIYSDGLESTLIQDRLPAPAMPIFMPDIAKLLRLPPDEVIQRMQERLDDTPGGLTHADDVSMIIVDVLDPTGTRPDAVV